MYLGKPKYYLFICLSLVLFFVVTSLPLTRKATYQKVLREDKRTRMDLAMEQEVARTKDPALGYVPKQRLLAAYDYAHARRTGAKAIAGVSWKERGPTNVGGRTRTIMVDPNEGTGKTVFSASVAGGLWKTTDITAEQPTWVSVNDFFENMAITTLAYDPSNTQTMYFGTGEGFFNADAVRGDGIWRSTDGGVSWSQLSATIGADFDYVNKIVVTSLGTVLAATRTASSGGGIMRSTNGGANWTRFTGLSSSRAADLEIAADGDIYGSYGIFSQDGIYKSTNDGAAWSRIYTSASDERRIEIATAPSNSNYIYALIHDSDNNGLKKIMRSTNDGSTWNTSSNPIWNDGQNCSITSSDFTRGQAWYDLIVAVDPNDEDVAWIGGVDLFRTINGGASWTQMTNWSGNCDFQEVHADQHAMIYEAGSSDVIYFGNDGGIYRVGDAMVTEPTFKRKEFNYNTTQFYSVAVNPTANSSQFISGAQDNGSNKFSELGLGPVVEVTGGDGGFAHIDALDSDFQFTSFTGLTFSRSTDGGLTFTFVAQNSNGSFINPSDYDPIGQDMYAGHSPGNYARWLNAHTTGSQFNRNVISSRLVSAFANRNVTAVTTSSSTGGKVWFGLNNDRVVLVTNAAGGNPSGSDLTSGGLIGGLSASISCIAHEEGNEDHLLVTLSNYGVTSVWETTNGGSTWTAVEGNLPDMPVRWALFNPADSDQAMIATELGVWTTDNLDGASTEWDPSNSGLANTRVDMLQIRSSDNLVVAATHGRGVFTSDIFTSVDADFVANKKVAYAESTIDFTDASYKATSWLWKFGDGGFSTAENPSHSYKLPGKYEVILTINAGANTEIKTDYIHILPNLGTPYTPADGGDFESNPDHFGSDPIIGAINLWEHGAPSSPLNIVNSGVNAWKTDLNADIIEADYQCALYSPNFNFSNAGTYSINFRKSMESLFSNAPIGAQVQYSLDNGLTWTRLGSDADANWYDKGPTDGDDNIETSVIHDRIGFNADYSNDATSYDVSFLAGNSTVAFRFVLFVDAGWSGGYDTDGFMIDDFEISGPVNDPVNNITDQFAGNALSCDGSSGYVQLSEAVVPETFSLTLWIDAQTPADNQSFVAKHDLAGTDIFRFGFYNGKYQATIRGESMAVGTKSTGLQHLAVVVEKLTASTSRVTIYKDGLEIGQQVVNEVIGDASGLAWVLGQDWDGVSTSDFFNGSFEEVALWGAALTESQIRERMHILLNGQENSLLNYWQFNEGSGIVTVDKLTSNTGGLVGTINWLDSNFPIGSGVVSTLSPSADGNFDFTGTNLSINFTGISGSGFDIVVSRIDANPGGTQPEELFEMDELFKNPYWIVEKYGTETFTSANMTYTLGGGAITESVPTKIELYKRGSSSAGDWFEEAPAFSIDNGTGTVVFNGITGFSQFIIGVPTFAVPIELLDFTAKWQPTSKSVVLEWVTATETNNDYFELQRSADAEFWTPISSIKGQGNSTLLNRYEYRDRELTSDGHTYYRLRQVDFDGSYSYGPIRLVIVPEVTQQLLSVYPNPITSNSKLKVELQSPGTVELRLYSMHGQLIRTKKSIVLKGMNYLDLGEYQDLPSGEYLLVLRGENYQHAIRIIR